MPWFFPEKRGPQWKHGWREQTLSSLSLPPPHLIAVFAIVILFLSMSWYADYRTQLHRTENGFRFLLFLLPAALAVVARYMVRDGRLLFRPPRAEQEESSTMHRGAGSSPWGVLMLVLLLLLMVSYQSTFHSQWFRPLWRVD